MQDSVVVKAPAKLNLFLRIIGQKDNGYHIIRTGITFLDLYDEINISLNDTNNLTYFGPYKPSSLIYEKDIIVKILNNIILKKKSKVKIKIKKNIPWKAGLGSASTNAASVIKGLQRLGLINDIDNNFLFTIGADVPACYYGKNCLVTGFGNKINTNIEFPNYYFVLVYPKIQLSTDEMYSKLKKYLKPNNNYNKQVSHLKVLHEDDNGNDFEAIVRKENRKISGLLDFLSNLKNNIFSRMSGSGSCCYAVFDNEENAKKAFDIISNKFSDYWIYLSKNNII